MNTWILALKEWNSKQTGKYQVPKKGTPAYDEIKRLQMKMKMSSGLGHSTKAPVKKAPVKKAPVKKAPVKMNGGEIIDPKVDIITSLDSFWKEITGSGLTKKQVKNIKMKTQHGGNWWDVAKALNTLNNFMIQPPPLVDTETGEVVVRSGFDMI